LHRRSGRISARDDNDSWFWEDGDVDTPFAELRLWDIRTHASFDAGRVRLFPQMREKERIIEK